MLSGFVSLLGRILILININGKWARELRLLSSEVDENKKDRQHRGVSSQLTAGTFAMTINILKSQQIK